MTEGVNHWKSRRRLNDDHRRVAFLVQATPRPELQGRDARKPRCQIFDRQTFLSTERDPAPATNTTGVVGTAAQPRSPLQSSVGGGDNALPAGYRLHEFEIIRVIGEGGFSIVYLVQDVLLQRKVALKEYIPTSFAGRCADNSVLVRSERHRETFELGLRSFINEGRLLASFDHPALIKVYRFWEQNGTAYMVMPFYSGPTLKLFLKQTAPPDETWLKHLLIPLLEALQIIHSDHCYHRDIAPDNILLLGPQLQPLLLDFGAARRVIGNATQALTVILKPGYAPIEQYAEVPSMKQGPWTDVYAVCAVLYMAITGRAPIASVGRLMHDELVPVASIAAGRYSPAFLAAIDRGLAVRPEDRPQDIATLRASLFTGELPGVSLRVLPGELPSDESDVTVIRPGGATTTLSPSPTLVRSKASWWVTGGLAAAVLLGSTWIATRPKPPTPPTQNTAVKPADVLARVPARGAFSVQAVLEDIVRHSDPLISVNTLADKERVIINRDKIRFRVKSSEAGYLYVFFSGTGDPNLTLLFPNALDSQNRIERDTEVLLPRDTWKVDASGPVGVNHIVTMVSRSPREFSGAGLQPAKPLSTFDLDTVKNLWASPLATSTPYAGTVQCGSASSCSTEFGATLLRISEVESAQSVHPVK